MNHFLGGVHCVGGTWQKLKLKWQVSVPYGCHIDVFDYVFVLPWDLLLQALAGPHFYTWGDHGGILMAIAQGGATTKLK